MNRIPALRFYLVRHGETNENRLGIIQGQMDTQLNRDGIIQSELCAERFRYINLHTALCSDLSRTVSTAEIILRYHPNITLNRDAGLRERYMGDFQGRYGNEYDRRKELEKIPETGEEFSMRIWTWWNSVIYDLLLECTENSTKHVLIISHGAYIKTLVRILLGEQVVWNELHLHRGPVYNTSVTTIDIFVRGRGVLRQYADISHFALGTDEETPAQTSPAVRENADDQVTQD